MSVPLRLVPLPGADWTRQIPQQLRRGFNWWIGQLSASLPPRLRRWTALAPDCIVLRLHDDQATAVLIAGGESRTLGGFAIAGSQPLPAGLRADLQRRISDRTRVIARLPDDRILQCTLKLPAATQENLRQVLGYEMDLHTPFTAEQVCFDYRITAADTEQIEVRLHVAPRAAIELALQAAGRLGLHLHAVDIEEPRTGSAACTQAGHLNLLPAALRPRRHTRRQMLDWGLGCMMAVLIAANLGLPFWRQQQQIATLQEALDTARTDAETAFSLRDQRDSLLKSLERIQAVNRELPSKLRILDEMSGLLPDDTWLQRVEIKGGSLQLQGESAGASALIGVLDRSALLEDVNFRSPVMQDPRSGKESFQISARLTSGDAQ